MPILILSQYLINNLCLQCPLNQFNIFYIQILMQFAFDHSVKLIGGDRTACLSWGIASIIWVLGFLYVSEHDIDSYSSNLSRGICLLLFNLPVVIRSRNELIDPISTRSMTIRHILLSIYSFIFAQCFFYLPITVVHTIYSSGPLFVLAIDYLQHNTMITKRQIIGVICAFTGVLFTINGQVLYTLFGVNDQHDSNFKYYRPESERPLIQFVACIILTIGTIGWAYAIVIVKKTKGVNHYQLNFHYGIILMSMAGLFYQQTNVKQQVRLETFLWSILYQGMPLAIGQAFFSHALTITKKFGVMTMIGFIGIVLGYFIKIFRYHENINFICLGGSLLIMFGVSRIVLREETEPPKQ